MASRCRSRSSRWPSCHHTMPQLANAANATTPVPISNAARPARPCASVRSGRYVVMFGTKIAGGAFGQRAAMQLQGRPDLTQRRRNELMPEPVMRSRTSPRFRGPSPRVRGHRRPDRSRSRFRTKLPRSASPLPASRPSAHWHRESDERKACGPSRPGRKRPDFTLPRDGGGTVSLGRFQGPQAGPLLLPQGRHAGLHQGGDRLQRAARPTSPRPTPISSAFRPTRCGRRTSSATSTS